MRIEAYGEVIVTPETIKVEGWVIHPEPDDDLKVPPHMALVQFAAKWALERLTNEVQRANLDLVRRLAKKPVGVPEESN